MHLQISYTNPETGVPSPEAALKIVDASVSLAQNRATVTASVWHNAATLAAGKAPTGEPSPITLTDAELATLKSTFETTLYELLKARGDYANGELVQ